GPADPHPVAQAGRARDPTAPPEGRGQRPHRAAGREGVREHPVRDPAADGTVRRSAARGRRGRARHDELLARLRRPAGPVRRDRPWRQGHERPGRVRGQARRLAAGTAGYRRDVLLLLLLIVPIVELYVLIQVGQEIGALETIGLLILVSIVGAWLA